YGVQIASYINVDNMKRQYAKIQEAGITDAFVQVVTMKENGKGVKYYRILIGAHTDLNELREREQKLKDQGYSTTYRKHL
ncbi:MAG: SPOR domain-containing protein, partial [Cytophagaceae bacterium]